MHAFGRGCVALTLCGLLFVWACSSEEGGSAVTPKGGSGGSELPAGNGGNGVGGAPSPSQGGALPSLGGSGVVVGISGAAGSAGKGASCAGDITKAELVPLDIFVMLDSSGSMLESTALGTTKWQDVSMALGSFFRDPGSAGLSVGLGYFPIPLEIGDRCTSDAECGEGAPCIRRICLNVLLDLEIAYECASDDDCDVGTDLPPLCGTLGECSALQPPDNFCYTELADETCEAGTCAQSGVCSRYVSCDAARYAAPAVPIAALPGNEPTLSASLQLRVPVGSTPTAPALQGALDQARSWAASHPGHSVVTLLATDGFPTECFADTAINNDDLIEEVAAAARAGVTDGIRSFVIGVFSATDIAAGARTNMDTVARAGGTEQSFIVDSSGNVAMEFLSALNQIRGSSLSCEFQVPKADGSGREVDYDKVNVELTADGVATRIPRAQSVAACDAARGGWFYDVSPGTAEPNRIILCEASCAAISSAQNVSVEIELGCQSEIIE